jgi:K+-sensing histidine kinase KdpD
MGGAWHTRGMVRVDTDTGASSHRRARVHPGSCGATTRAGSPEGAVPEPSPADQAAAEAYSELCSKVVHAFNHDLRTPLTTLLCHTELLLETEATPEAAHLSLAAMKRAGQTIKERLASLVLSVDAHDEASAGRVHVHLPSLLRGLVTEVDSLSPSRAEIRLTTIGTEEFLAVVNPALVRRGVVELLNNALNNALEGSTIWLSSRIEAAEVCIEVRDQGPGLDKRERLRPVLPAGDDASRLRGSGLAIASSVAAAHGGRLELTDLADGGLSATLRLDLRTLWGA